MDSTSPIPTEILTSPEYQPLIDAAKRHIQLINQQKEAGTEPISIIEPPQHHPVGSLTDSEFGSDASDWEYNSICTPGSLNTERDRILSLGTSNLETTNIN